jgi:cell wall-associated NlpC family hydrolase
VTDRRLLAANGRVAHIALRGAVTARRFVAPVRRLVAVPVADLLAAPDGARDRQLLFGEAFDVLEIDRGHAFGLAPRDGYVGYVAAGALTDAAAPTHRVAARATHVYTAPDIKTGEIATLSLGSRVAVADDGAPLARLATGGFVPAVHLAPLDRPEPDPVAVAERLLGTPYLWGGNSAFGIDCSGLVQIAALACGLPCPGDSDLQAAALGTAAPHDAPYARGDLVFWQGHVAIVAEPDRLVHANAHRMAVAVEGLGAAIARIADQGGGPPTGRGRLAGRPRG